MRNKEAHKEAQGWHVGETLRVSRYLEFSVSAVSVMSFS